MSRFTDCLSIICDAEGGYVDDPLDRGGATNCGITTQTYHNWLTHHGLPLKDVRDLTEEEEGAIYQDSYWTSNLPIGLDLLVFDSAVQHGKNRAIRWLQGIIGVATDGVIGPKTMYRLNAYVLQYTLPVLIAHYIEKRRQFYAAIITSDPTQARFKRGWENRMTKLEGILNGL